MLCNVILPVYRFWGVYNGGFPALSQDVQKQSDHSVAHYKTANRSPERLRKLIAPHQKSHYTLYSIKVYFASKDAHLPL